MTHNKEPEYREDFRDSGYGASRSTDFSGSRVFDETKVDTSVPSLDKQQQPGEREQPDSSASISGSVQPLPDRLLRPESAEYPTYLGKRTISLALEEPLESCEGTMEINPQKGRDEIVFYSEKTRVKIAYPIKKPAIGSTEERVSVEDCRVRVYSASLEHLDGRDGWIAPVIEVSKRSPLLDFAEMTFPADFSLSGKKDEEGKAEEEESVAILHAKPAYISFLSEINFDVIASFRKEHCHFSSDDLEAEYRVEKHAVYVKMKKHCLVTLIAKKRNVIINSSFDVREEHDGGETFDVKFFISSIYEKAAVQNNCR